MRRLIPLFLSLIIPIPALATATCTTTTEPKACREIPGCTWAGTFNKECRQCGEGTYGDNGDCKSCSKLSGTVDGKTITGHWDASDLGSAKHECYADCDAKLEAVNKNGSTGKWMLGNDVHQIQYGTTDPRTMCKFACYTSDNGYNICNSYYSTKINNNEICTPTWKLVSSNEINPDIDEHYMCDPKTTKTAIMYSFSEYGVYDVCFARECADGYHLIDGSEYLYNYSINPEEYSCKFADNTEISNAEMFQTCEPNIISCTVSLGKTCNVEIGGVTKTGTVGGNAVWNGINAYNKDQCTCTVSDDDTGDTDKYKRVCKLSTTSSTTSNTWDGASCETSVKECKSGNCIVGYDANNKNQTCAPAPQGYYSGQKVLECDKCPAGKTTASTGRTSIGECTYSTETQFCDGDGVDCFKLNYSSLGS